MPQEVVTFENQLISREVPVSIKEGQELIATIEADTKGLKVDSYGQLLCKVLIQLIKLGIKNEIITKRNSYKR
jgi:hypothetical protein